jgi:hypothetical protein
VSYGRTRGKSSAFGVRSQTPLLAFEHFLPCVDGDLTTTAIAACCGGRVIAQLAQEKLHARSDSWPGTREESRSCGGGGCHAPKGHEQSTRGQPRFLANNGTQDDA